MKYIYKFVFTAIFIFGLLFMLDTVFAEVANEKMPVQVANKKAPEKEVLLLATVNIYGAKIDKQVNNVFNISFELNNKEITQSGVKYAVILYKETDKGQFIIDQKIYDEKIDLAENTSIKKDIIYTAPSNLEGEYMMIIKSRNESSLPLASSFLGTVKLTSSNNGVNILPETCFLWISGDKENSKYTLSQGVDIQESENLNLTCNIENKSKNTITLVPTFETYYRTVFGGVVEQKGGEVNYISVKPNEKKIVSVVLPKATKPQAYDIKMTLRSVDSETNPIIVHYVLKGLSATIQNISLDKDYYKKNEKANISFYWARPADNFPDTRLGSTDIGTIDISLSLTNEEGKECGKPVKQQLDSKITNPKIDISYPIKNDCLNPRISATLADVKGNILDQKTYNFETKSKVPQNTKTSSYFTLGLIVFLFIILVIYLKKKNKDNFLGPNSVNTFLMFIIIFISGFFIPSNFVRADTFSIGDTSGNFWANVEMGINKNVFRVGDSITAGGSIEYAACANDAPTAKMSAQMVERIGVTSHWGSGWDLGYIINGVLSGGAKIEKFKSITVPNYASNNFFIDMMVSLTGESVGEYATGQRSYQFMVEGVSTCLESHFGCSGGQTATETVTEATKYTWKCPPITDSGDDEGFSTSSCEEAISATGVCDLKSTSMDRDEFGVWYTVPAYKCLVGTPGDIDRTNSTWTCTGLDGSPTACTFPPQGECFPTNYDDKCKCEVGTVMFCTVDPITGYAAWICDVSDPGSDKWCGVEIPPSYPRDGLCNNKEKNSCYVGSVIEESISGNKYYWKCEGLNGGATAGLCVFDADTQPYGNITASPSSCTVPVGASSCSGILISYDIYNESSLSDAHAWDGFRNIEQDWSPRGTWQNNNKPYIMDNFATRGLNRTISLVVYPKSGFETIVLDSVDVSAILKPNLPPTTPEINGPIKLMRNAVGNFTVVSVDPDPEGNPKIPTNKDLYYIIDWDNNGTADQWLPAKAGGATVYVQSGVKQPFNHAWPNLGTYTFKVRSIDYHSKPGEESPWAPWTVEIVDESSPFGTLEPSGCKIKENESNCNEASIKWTTINLLATLGIEITRDNPAGTPVISLPALDASLPLGTKSNLIIERGTTYFYLRHDGKLLDKQPAFAECDDTLGLVWNITSNRCEKVAPTIPTVTLTATPPIRIAEVQKALLKWEPKNAPNECIASGDWGGNKLIAGGTEETPVLTEARKYIYNIKCKNGAGEVSATAELNAVKGTLSVPSCIIPSGGSSCPTNLKWSVENPDGGTYTITEDGSAIRTGSTGDETISLQGHLFGGIHHFWLNLDGVGQLAGADPQATCVLGTSWDGFICKPAPATPKNINSFEVIPDRIIKGKYTSLNWNIELGFTSCNITSNPGAYTSAVDVNQETGKVYDNPNADTIYTLTCSNAAGSTSKSDNVKVIDPNLIEN